MLVDDELPALKIAGSVLKSFENINICGIYSDPDELLECLAIKSADLVLVDMKMPGMHGLELAGRIQAIRPEAFIVFVTAYDDFAVDAFETEALDYILKPITVERMNKTLERYSKRRFGGKQEDEAKCIVVQSFKRFSVKKVNGESMKFRTAKAEELMAFLLHHHGEPITKERIIDDLWYDRDVEKAQSMLYTTLYQLRKDLDAFGLTDIIQHGRKEGWICRLSWVPDQWDYTLYAEGCGLNKAGGIAVEQAKKFVDIYKGGYLEDNGYSWAENRKNELELWCTELLEGIAYHEMDLKRYDFAMQYLKRWAEISPYTELVYLKMMALYFLMNKKEAAYSYYQRIKDMFIEEIGETLSIDMEKLALDPKSAFREKIPVAIL